MSAGVVEALDVILQGKSGFGLCGKTPAINQFAFQNGVLHYMTLPCERIFQR